MRHRLLVSFGYVIIVGDSWVSLVEFLPFGARGALVDQRRRWIQSGGKCEHLLQSVHPVMFASGTADLPTRWGSARREVDYCFFCRSHPLFDLTQQVDSQVQGICFYILSGSLGHAGPTFGALWRATGNVYE